MFWFKLISLSAIEIIFWIACAVSAHVIWFLLLDIGFDEYEFAIDLIATGLLSITIMGLFGHRLFWIIQNNRLKIARRGGNNVHS